MSADLVTLSFCGDKFIATKDTLCRGFKYFERLFSPEWMSPSDRDPNKRIFLEMRKDVFQVLFDFISYGVFAIPPNVCYEIVAVCADFLGIKTPIPPPEEEKPEKPERVMIKGCMNRPQTITVIMVYRTSSGSVAYHAMYVQEYGDPWCSTEDCVHWLKYKGMVNECKKQNAKKDEVLASKILIELGFKEEFVPEAERRRVWKMVVD